MAGLVDPIHENDGDSWFSTLIAVDYWRSGAVTGKRSSGTKKQLNLYRIINFGGRKEAFHGFLFMEGGKHTGSAVACETDLQIGGGKVACG